SVVAQYESVVSLRGPVRARTCGRGPARATRSTAPPPSGPWRARPSAARAIRARLPDGDGAPDGVARGGRDRDRVAARAQGAHLDLIGALGALDRAALHALSAARDRHRHLRGLAEGEADHAGARERGRADARLGGLRRGARDRDGLAGAEGLVLVADELRV